MRRELILSATAVARSEKRLRAEKAALNRAVVRAAPCSLCGAKKNQRCIKGGPGGRARAPHSERRIAAGTKAPRT